jgi:hypothetical protein
MTLCNTCKGIAPLALFFIKKPPTGFYMGEDPLKHLKTYSHYPSFELLRSSSESCKMCAFILKGFERDHDIAEIFEYSATGKGTPIFVEFSGRTDLGDKYRTRCCNLLPHDRPRGDNKCWWGKDLLIYIPRGEYSLIKAC